GPWSNGRAVTRRLCRRLAVQPHSWQEPSAGSIPHNRFLERSTYLLAPAAGATIPRRPPRALLAGSEEPGRDDGEAATCIAGAGDQVLQPFLAVVQNDRVDAVRECEGRRDEDTRRIDGPGDSTPIRQRPRVDGDWRPAGTRKRDRLLQIRSSRICAGCRGQRGSTYGHQEQNGEQNASHRSPFVLCRRSPPQGRSSPRRFCESTRTRRTCPGFDYPSRLTSASEASRRSEPPRAFSSAAAGRLRAATASASARSASRTAA